MAAYTPRKGDFVALSFDPQVKSIDYRSRDAKRIGIAPQAVLDEALALLDACIY